MAPSAGQRRGSGAGVALWALLAMGTWGIALLASYMPFATPEFAGHWNMKEPRALVAAGEVCWFMAHVWLALGAVSIAIRRRLPSRAVLARWIVLLLGVLVPYVLDLLGVRTY